MDYSNDNDVDCHESFNLPSLIVDWSLNEMIKLDLNIRVKDIGSCYVYVVFRK